MSAKKDKNDLMNNLNKSIRGRFEKINGLVKTRWRPLVEEIKQMILQRKKHTTVYDVFTDDERAEVKDYFLQNIPIINHTTINFSRPDLIDRYQAMIYDSTNKNSSIPTVILNDFTNVISLCFEKAIYKRFSIIYSMNNCNRQPLHCDDAKLETAMAKNSRIKYETMSFTIIGALGNEDNQTNIYLARDNDKEEKVCLPPGSIIILRGDKRHAGAEYNQTNHRLFMSIGTEKFPNENEYTGGLDPTDEIQPSSSSVQLTIHAADDDDKESREDYDDDESEEYSPDDTDEEIVPGKRKGKAKPKAKSKKIRK